MAHGIGGNVIGATLAGSPFNIEITGWRVRPSVGVIDDTAPGDTHESRIPSYGDWTAEFEGHVPDQANRHILAANETTLGSEVAIGLKEKLTDTNPVFLGTGLAVDIELDAMNKRGPIMARGTVQCSTGAGPTWDTTPTS